MNYRDVVKEVKFGAQLTSEREAVAAVSATLRTLSERITGDEGEHLAAELPPEIGRYLREGTPTCAENFSLDEFNRRVGEREGCDASTASVHAGRVMEALQHAVSGGELRHVRNRLGADFEPLFAGCTFERPAPVRRH